MRQLAGIAIVSMLAYGQAAEPFAAADVHVSASGTTESGGFMPGGRVEFRATTLLRLISLAYSTPEDRIGGGPSWINTDRFDVVAIAEPNVTSAGMRTRLQELLQQRFGLSVQRGDTPRSVYVLTLAKGPGKESPGDPDCRLETQPARVYTCRHVTMAGIAERLPLIAPGYFEKPVVDKTGLTGPYDFRLEWLPKGQLNAENQSQSLFSVVEKQLGVKIETQTAPLPTLTVASVNRVPSPNPAGTVEKLGAPPTEFDVASLYKSRPDEQSDVTVTAGRLDAKAISLREMIGFAYNVEEEWVKGGDKWIDTERYDIRAKSIPTASADAMRVMVQSLLRDRFRLQVHKEDQPVSVFALTAPKPRLKDADAAIRFGCKLQPGATRTYTCQSATMSDFAAKLQSLAPRYIDHPVVDLTGLKGSYDFTLSWTVAPVIAADGSEASDRVQVTIFEAIDKQLGLKLSPQKHPMPVLVIDHVDRAPTEN
jgi:uncharacterized protein (TIGR03435 family)